MAPMDEAERRSLTQAAVLLAAVTVVRAALAARWGLLADEAWYLAWSRQPAWGYYDQPPLIAWILAISRQLGEAPGVLRAVPVATGLVIPLVLLPFAGDRSRWLAWCALLPPLTWLTIFATPDAPLLALWAIALAGALRGGRGWLVAGVAAGLAFQAKHTGALVFPLLLVARRETLKEPWPWVGAALALGLATPNLVWNAVHDGVTVRFQLGEGLLHHAPPGPIGGVLQVIGQLGVATPVAGICGYTWCVVRASQAWSGPPLLRVCWWTSAPLLAGFAVAGFAAPGEAHWPAPAWIGLGLALSAETGSWARGTALGLGLAGVLGVLLAVHSVRPVARWPADPAIRLTEGPVLGAIAARWLAAEPGGDAPILFTERYQEAAHVMAATGAQVWVHPGCGRPGQQDLWPPAPPTDRALFLRPATGGPPHCLDRDWTVIRGPILVQGADAFGRRVGPWQLFELEAR